MKSTKSGIVCLAVLLTGAAFVAPGLVMAEADAQKEVIAADETSSRSYIKQHGVPADRDFTPWHDGDQTPNGDNVVVPEPATLALLGLGLASLGVARRRGRKKD